MIFNSLEFLIFLPIVFILFWACPQRFRWIVLLLASYFFYMYWNWKLVFLILTTTVVSYVCAMLLERFNTNKKLKIAIVSISLTVCFGILLFFKYFNFFYEIFGDIYNAISQNTMTGIFTIILPVGISFYTFQTASYVIDVYKGTYKAEKHFGYYALFVTFFPQLVAGPIERPNDLLPQLRSDKKLSNINYTSAFRYMLIGFFKKIAIADVVGIFVNATYNDLSEATGLMVLISTVLFSIQIFCDFSGYCDIAIGCAKLFGIELTENFNEPYKSKSIKEFWNRWHITLSRWLRDYIYFPLGGSRVSKLRWALNIAVVFFISGLWHGANYTFLVWGLLHALFQIVGALTIGLRNKAWRAVHINPQGGAVSVLRVMGTFCLVTFAWIFFRANTIQDAFTAIGKLFTDYGGVGYWTATIKGLSLTVPFVIFMALAIPFMFALEPLKCVKGNSLIYKNVFSHTSLRNCTYVVIGFLTICSWVYLQASDIGSSFIYFQF